MSETTSRDALLRTARKRLYPSLTDPNFLVLQPRRLIFEKWVEQLPAGKLMILDIGGRYQPYRSLFEGRTAQYVGFDLLRTELVDVIGDAEMLPFTSDAFDVVIATQVFEYFSEPCCAARQIRHALKPGGALLMSVASFAPRFVDEERWRFTAAGIQATLKEFSRVEIRPELFSAAGLLRSLNLGLHAFMRNRLMRKLYEYTVCIGLNTLGLVVERLRLTNNDQFTSNYSVLAIK